MTGPACVALLGFADRQPVCGKPAVVVVIVTGSRVFDSPPPGEPHCERCARIVARIVSRYFPGASYSDTPIAPSAPAA